MIKNIFVTGAAGFIGAALVNRLLKYGFNVVGLDNLNAYYDVNLKIKRLEQINLLSKGTSGRWHFFKDKLESRETLKEIFYKFSPNIVINLAAQAGVRHSLENPSAYIQSNLVGFANLLEECKKSEVENFIFASSSSVYGGNKNLPFSEDQPVDHPVSLYAATKRANELMAHSYSHLYNIPSIGLRFFTVYGSWGRPDMAPMIFAKSILKKEAINIFNYGKMERDFTYIDDVVEVIFRCCKKPATPGNKFDHLSPNPSNSSAPFRIFNVGNRQPVSILKFIEILEEAMGIKTFKNYLPIQPGDVEATAADTTLLEEWINFRPSTELHFGVGEFAKWYIDYCKN